MSFAVSLDGGRLEYSGGVDLGGLFAQRRNVLRPRFWSMLNDLRRFYASAPRDVAALGGISLGDYLAAKRLWRRLSRGSSAADGRGDLVLARGNAARLSGAKPSSDSSTITAF